MDTEQSATPEGKVVNKLVKYFVLPGTSGFSPYRTGWIAHFALSFAIAAAALAGTRALGLAWIPGLVIAALCCVLLWGPGAIVGVMSHHNPPLVLVPLAAAVAVWFIPWARPHFTSAFGVAMAVHLLIVPAIAAALGLLKRLAERGSPKAED